jgi:PASTA domain
MNSDPRLAGARALTGVIAAIVLAVGAFALIRRGDDTPSPPPPTSTSTPSSTTGRTATTATTAPAPNVSVPNVVGLTREAALTALQTAGLESHVESLPIDSAPSGFVLSQSPPPASQIPEGSTVALVVSAAP